MDTFSWLLSKFQEKSALGLLWHVISDNLKPNEFKSQADLSQFLDIVKMFGNGPTRKNGHRPVAKADIHPDTTPLENRIVQITKALHMYRGTDGKPRLAYSTHRVRPVPLEFVELVIEAMMGRTDLQDKPWSATRIVSTFPRTVDGTKKSWSLTYHSFMAAVHAMIATGLIKRHKPKRRAPDSFCVVANRCWKNIIRKAWKNWENELTAPTVKMNQTVSEKPGRRVHAGK